MKKHKKRASSIEDAATTLERVAEILAPWCPLSHEDLASMAATGLSAWANEKKPDTLVNLFAALKYWSRYWKSEGPDLNPLSEEGLTCYCARLRDEGMSSGLVLQRLSSIRLVSRCIGMLTPEFLIAHQKVRRLYTGREFRRRPTRDLPFMVADVRRLIRNADPARPRDVRNVLVMLILYEAMASFKELIGPALSRAQLDVGPMLSDVRFEETGTSLLRLHPRSPEVAGRTVRLSADTTAWLHHWLAMRGCRPGHLLSFRPPEGSGDLKLARVGAKALWYGPAHFRRLASRHGVNGDRLSASSLKLGRAVALLDAGYSLSYVAEAGGWSSAVRLAWSLDAGLTIRRQARHRREPLQLSWPRPAGEPTGAAPAQLELTLAYAA